MSEEHANSAQADREAGIVVLIDSMFSVAALLGCPPSDLAQEIYHALREFEGTTSRITQKLASDSPVADVEANA